MADFGLRLIGISCFTLFIAAIYKITGKASDIGFISVATVGPAFLVMLISGKYTARLSPLGTIRTFTIARATLFAVGGAFAEGEMSILIAAALQSLIHQGSASAKMALDAETLAESARRTYNARKTMLGNVAIVAGPPLGGAAIAYAGISLSLFVMAGFSVIVAVLLSMVGAGHGMRSTKPADAGASPLASLKHLLSIPQTFFIVAAFCLVTVILEVQAPLLFPFVREEYGRESDYTGLLLGLAGIGGIAGAFLAQRFPKHLTEGSVPWLVAADGAVFLLFTQLEDPTVASALFTLLGAMGAITLIVVEGAVQRDVEASHRPFVFSLMQFAAGAGGASFGIATAFLAESYGAQTVLASAAGVEIAFGAICLLALRMMLANQKNSASISDREERAISLARQAGYLKLADEDFSTFWSRIPISDAVDHASKNRRDGSARIFLSSGGSTATSKFTLLDFSEVLKNSAIHGQGYRACGIQPSDVVATWGVPGIMSSEFTVYLALAETGCCILPIGDTSNPATIVKLVRDFGATVLLVMPSDLNPIVTLLEDQSAVLDSIRLVVTGGEALLPTDRQRYRGCFAHDVEFRSVYQTSDTGTIGYQCPSSAFDEYHVHEDLQLIEIVNAGPDGTGELLTTNLQRQLVPVLRQRTGDLARRLEGACLCGRKSSRIQFKGRTGKYVKFGGEKFDLNWMVDLKEALSLPSDDFQVVLKRDNAGRDCFVLRSNRVFNDPRLQALSVSLFTNLCPKIAAQLERRVVGELAFAALNEADLLATAAGKTKFFTDIRNESRSSIVTTPAV